jgi:AcrR family transcriptional regulator
MNTRGYRMTARAASTETTRQRLEDAMLARFRGAPFAMIRLDDVAADAEVTVQTAIRHFGGKEQLMAAVAAREVERIAASRADASFAVRDTAVAALCRYYERDGDLIARFEQEASAIPALADLARRGREVHIDWITRVFAADSGDGDSDIRLAQLVALLDVRTWQVIRRERGLSPADTLRALERLVSAVTGRAGGGAEARR